MNEPAPQRSAQSPLRIVITGAASGVGAKLAREFRSRGAALFLADHDEVALARLRLEMDSAAVRCDILDERSVAAMFESAEAALGGIDVLINAAGSGYVRTLGVMRASREFARRPRSGRAHIINIAAQSDDSESRFEYSGSKVAFSRLADGLARAIESPDLTVLTLDHIEDPAAISDLAEQVNKHLSNSLLGYDVRAARRKS